MDKYLNGLHSDNNHCCPNKQQLFYNITYISAFNNENLCKTGHKEHVTCLY